MAVAYQTQKEGQQPAGMELFDISNPEKPRSISFYDCSASIRAACTSSGSATANTSTWRRARRPSCRRIRSDDQFYRRIDVRNPSKPVEVGRWHCRAPSRATTRRRRRAIRSTRRLSRPQLQRLPCSARTVAVSPISTAACIVLDIPNKADPQAHLSLDQLAALHRLHAHRGAAVRPRPDAGDRRIDRGQRQGLAEARLDPRRPRRDQPCCRSRPARCPTPASPYAGARPVRRPQHP